MLENFISSFTSPNLFLSLTSHLLIKSSIYTVDGGDRKASFRRKGKGNNQDEGQDRPSLKKTEKSGLGGRVTGFQSHMSNSQVPCP